MPCGSLHTWFLIQLSPSGMYQKNVKDYTEVFAANVNLCYMTLPKKKKNRSAYILIRIIIWRNFIYPVRLVMVPRVMGCLIWARGTTTVRLGRGERRRFPGLLLVKLLYVSWLFNLPWKEGGKRSSFYYGELCCLPHSSPINAFTVQVFDSAARFESSDL